MFIFLLKVDRYIWKPEFPFFTWCFANWYWLLLGCLLISILTRVRLYIESNHPQFFALFDFEKILHNDKIPTFVKNLLLLFILFFIILPFCALLIYVFGNLFWEYIKFFCFFAYIMLSAIWYQFCVPMWYWVM